MTSYRRPRRRASGEGSVYLSRTEGRWRGALTWTDEAGVLRRRLVSGKSQADVRRRLGELRTSLDHGLVPVATGTTGAYLLGWLERHRARVRPSTWRGYAQVVRSRLVPELGRIPLDKLTPAHVEAMLTRLVGSGRSARTAFHVRGILRLALGAAVRDGILHRNVAALARPPRMTPRGIEAGRDFLTTEDLHRLLRLAPEYRVGSLVTVAALTGLRVGELLGLAWTDVDWEAGTLTVNRSLARAARGGYELAPPKTARSRRTVYLPPAAIEALRREERDQAAAREAAGTAWQDAAGLVFTTPIGTALDPTAVGKAWHELRDAAGLPPVPLRGLRHSAASAMLASGVPLSTVSAVLGHTGVGVTALHYAGIERELLRDAAERLGRALGDER